MRISSIMPIGVTNITRIFALVVALLSIMSCSSKFETAYDLYNKKDYKRTIEECKARIRQFPDSEFADNAQYMIGVSHYHLKNYDASQRAYIELLDDFPNSELIGNAQREIAILFFNNGEYEAAYQELKKFSTKEFKNYPDFQAEAKYIAAVCLYRLGNFDEIPDLVNKLIEQFPKSEWVDDALLLIGKLNFHQRSFQEALGAYESILELNSESDIAVSAKVGIANSYFGLKKWSKAIDVYERILKEHKEAKNIIPKSCYQIAETYYKLATEHREKGEIKKASENFEKALIQYQNTLKDFPTDEVAWYAWQGIMWVLNDLGRERDLEDFVLNHGGNSPMHRNAISHTGPTGFSIDLGLFYFRIALTQERHLKDYKKALESYQEAIQQVNNPFIKAQSYYRCGLIYQDKLNPLDREKALGVFKDLISSYADLEDPIVASIVADARLRRSKLLGIVIPEEEKSNLIDRKTLSSTVFLVMKDTNGKLITSGSGFFVGPGQIATNYHVVEGAAGGHAELGFAELDEKNGTVEDNTRYDIQGHIAIDVERDLIILKVSEGHFSPSALPLGDSDAVKRTNSVYAVGTPLGQRYMRGTRTPGVISNILKDNTGKLINFLMTAPISPGNSGGPVLNNNGEVVGIAVSQMLSVDPKLKVNRAQNLNWAIPSNDLNILLQKVGPPKPLWQLDPLWQLEVTK